MSGDLESSQSEIPDVVLEYRDAGEGFSEDFQLEELRRFVGSNANYYLRKWTPLLHGEIQGLGFNWAAFLLAGLWLPYRKMYKVACVFYAFIFLESVFEELLFVGVLGEPETPAGLSHLVGLVAAGVCGAMGNRWYLSHAEKAISDVHAEGLSGETRAQTISRRGGVSLGSSFGFFLLFLASLFCAFIILDIFLYQAKLGSVVELNDNDEVYYSNEATEADARALGEMLTEIGIFGDPAGASVKVEASSGGFVISFILVEKAWEDPEVVGWYQELSATLAADRFGRPLTIDLCNEYFEVQRSLRIE